MTVLLLPYAGASRHSYNFLIESFMPETNVLTVELPGRGARVKEPLVSDINELTNEVFQQVVEKLRTPYVIYGHSMGAIIALLLGRMLASYEREKLPMPEHFIVSGRGGPFVRTGKMDHRLPREQFVKRLKKLDRTSCDLWNNLLFVDFYEPILRNDFQAHETYVHTVAKPLDVPITVLIGSQEGINNDQAVAWQHETSLPVVVRYFDGDHFFIRDHAATIASVIQQPLITSLVNQTC
jgi:surfactin synthase thioesterase subunit